MRARVCVLARLRLGGSSGYQDKSWACVLVDLQTRRHTHTWNCTFTCLRIWVCTSTRTHSLTHSLTHIHTVLNVFRIYNEYCLNEVQMIAREPGQHATSRGARLRQVFEDHRVARPCKTGKKSGRPRNTHTHACVHALTSTCSRTPFGMS